jgi:hypothetical protein
MGLLKAVKGRFCPSFPRRDNPIDLVIHLDSDNSTASRNNLAIASEAKPEDQLWFFFKENMALPSYLQKQFDQRCR